MANTQQATVILALATVFGAFIGSLTQLYIKRLDVRRKRKSLRRAFIAELKGFPDLNDEKWLSAAHLDDTSDIIPTHFYESNTADIGELTPEEANEVAKFYSALLSYKQLMAETPYIAEEGEEFLDLQGSLQEKRESAIETLEENL